MLSFYKIITRSLFFVAVVVLMLLWRQPVQAIDVTYGISMSSEDKAAVHEALLAIKKKRWKQAETLIAETRDPLAAKIYYWFYYTKAAGPVQFSRISSFARQNPDWPLQGKLELYVEKAMPSDLPDEEVVRWFRDHDPKTSDGMAHYLKALKNRGMDKTLKKISQGWWREALLSPQQQQRFLQRYKTLLDREDHVARMNMLLFNRHYTNAKVIAGILGKGHGALVQARIALAEDKSGVDHIVASVPPHLKNDPGLLYERLNWRRRHKKNFAAIEILHNPPPAETIPNLAGWWKERHIIARRLMESGQYESAYLLVEKHQQEEGLGFAQAEFLAGWLALRFMEKPWRAFEHFEALYHRTSTPISRARAAYWAGRASEGLGHPDIARQWFRMAARHQTAFYGQLAVGALETEHKPPQQVPPERTLAGHQLFSGKEMVQAVQILNSAGLRKETTAFLDALARQVDVPEDYRLVAELAEEMGHNHNAIRIAKRGLNRDIFLMEQAYPTMLSRMRHVDVEWALVHALIRQESAFDEKAVSPAGARGLMQLMPATARGTARRLKTSHRTGWLTSNPEHNIRLGVSYLQQMLDRFDGSYPLALAAYNAGPGRVDRWLRQFGDPREKEIDIVDWIELIPVYETRNYVQRVLEGVYIYRLKLRDIQKNIKAPIHVALYK